MPQRNISAKRGEDYVTPEIESAAVELNDLTFRRLRLPLGNVSAGRDDSYGSPEIDSAAVELNDLTFRRLRLTHENVSVERDENYVPPKIDSAAVELNDLYCRRLSSVSKKFAADACGSVQQDITIFRHTDWPPDDFAAGRNGDYIRHDLWTGPSVCNEPVTGSHVFGSSQRLGRCCLWWAALPSHEIGSAEVPLIPLLLLVVSGDEPHETHVEPANRNAIVEWSKYDFVIFSGFSTVSARCMARWRK